MDEVNRKDWLSVCPECHASYSPRGGGHCRGGKYGGCCQTFTSDDSADRHRTGPGDERRCFTVEELLSKGWRSTARGWTHRPPMSEEAKMAKRGN